MDNRAIINYITPKNSYIIKDNIPENFYILINELLFNNFNVFCITRTNPIELKSIYNINPTFLWLTNQKSTEFITSIDISDIIAKTKNFIKNSKRCIIIIDRIDYLITMFGFNEFLKMIYLLNDEAYSKNAIILVCVNPKTINTEQLNLLEQELKKIPKSEPIATTDLSDDLIEILSFVNSNEKVTFKRITKEFRITKTTTRKRINNLEKKGLVIIRKNGRNKIVRITEQGKAIL